MEQTANGIVLENDTARMTVHGDGPSRAFIENYFKHWSNQPGITVELRAQSTGNTPPRAGENWPEQGGIYAGEIRGENGAPNHHLILLDQPEPAAMPWQKAMDWAAGLKTHYAPGFKVHVFSDWALPTRREQRLLFVNAREHFQEAWYWSGEQHAANSLNAWVQGFGNGNQDNHWKDDEYRVLAVRRVVIQ